MEDIFTKAESLAAHVKEYADNRVATLKLKTAEKTSAIAANIIAVIIVGIVFLLFFVFASIALAYVLADVTGKISLGFLLVAGFYLVAAIIIWFGRKKIIMLPVLNGILKQLFKEDEED